MAELSDMARQRLGQLALARRKELGLSLREAARRSGLMRPTWTGLEQGTRRTAEYNFATVERTLQWAPGSIDRILHGEGPVPAAQVGTAGAMTNTVIDVPADSAVRWPDVIDVLDRHLAEVGQIESLTGAQRLWGVERITSLARRLRPKQVRVGGDVMVVWSEIVAALDAAIADVRADVTVGSEQRLWGVELAVEIAIELRGIKVSLGN